MPKFIGELKPAGNFTLVDASNIRGGLMQVETLEERDTLPTDKVKLNSFVFVNSTKSLFRYTESGWVQYKDISYLEEQELFRKELGYENLINNPHFITGFHRWNDVTDYINLTVTDKAMLPDQIFLYSTDAQVIVENGQTILRLLGNSPLTQSNDNLKSILDFDTSSSTWFDVIYTYETLGPGTLTISLGTDVKDSFDFILDGYNVHRASFKWDGTGDLSITCSGDIKIKSFVIRPNEAKTLIDTYIASTSSNVE